MYVQTKKELYDFVKEQTQKFQKTNMDVYTANYISSELKISRNLASQYLNDLEKDGTIVKVRSRPVYFLHRQVLEETYGVHLKEKEAYLSMEELISELEQGFHGKSGFEKLIGYNSGLSYEVEQCKAAMNYPPDGLPVLMVGQNGTGKSYMVSLMYEYAIQRNLISKDRNMITFSCSEYKDTRQAAIMLFGQKKTEKNHLERDRQGCLEKAEGGILYLTDIHNLGMELQEKLFRFLESGMYRRIDESETLRQGHVRLIFSTSQNPEEALLKKLLRRLPVVVRMSAFSERSEEEKEEMIFHFFRQESRRIGREVWISSKVFDALLQYEFPGNIEQLRNCIQTSCAAALLNCTDDEAAVEVYLYHLPEELILRSRIETIPTSEERNLLNVKHFQKDESTDAVMSCMQEILEIYDRYCDGICEQDDFLECAFQAVSRYADYLIFERRFVNTKISAMEQVLENVFNAAADKFYIQFPVHLGYIFSRSLFSHRRSTDSHVDEKISECMEILKRCFSKEGLLAEEVSNMIEQGLDTRIDAVNRMLLLLFIRQYNQAIRKERIRCVIICHGYSTASSTADVANRLLGSHLFEAIDMPIDVSVQDIAVRFKNHIDHITGPKDVILLVDMGSLEDIDILLNHQLELNLGIINNVSTRLAVNVGEKVQQGLPLEEILRTSSKEHVSAYKLLERAKRKAAILFISEVDIQMAKRMADLFRNSLPKSLEIELLAYDYLRIRHQDCLEELKKYDLLFASGTVNPELENIPYISMEDIISFKEMERINRILAHYIEESEIEEFDQKLLKNFSLQNVVQYLTILNADKVLDLVGQALYQMQRILGTKFSARTMIGLNIHLSCLIERLVTKTPIQSYLDIEQFESQQVSFIQITKTAFANISEHYRVELPVSEIAYIHEYIIHDQKESDTL